jgi:hypothetical protein
LIINNIKLIDNATNSAELVSNTIEKVSINAKESVDSALIVMNESNEFAKLSQSLQKKIHDFLIDIRQGK